MKKKTVWGKTSKTYFGIFKVNIMLWIKLQKSILAFEIKKKTIKICCKFIVKWNVHMNIQYRIVFSFLVLSLLCILADPLRGGAAKKKLFTHEIFPWRDQNKKVSPKYFLKISMGETKKKKGLAKFVFLENLNVWRDKTKKRARQIFFRKFSVTRPNKKGLVKLFEKIWMVVRGLCQLYLLCALSILFYLL